MKAACIRNYGGPEKVKVEEIPIPYLSDNEVLIKVYASSVNSGDVRLRKADPWAVRLFFGLTKPKKPVLGLMFSGVVAKSGSTVFNIGDEVFGSTGMKLGAHAEYLVVSCEGLILHKPVSLSHTETSSILFGAATAYHFIKKTNISTNSKVMVYGSSGAVGSAILQICKSYGAHVTAVCSNRHMASMKKLGADRIIDYTKENISQSTEKYDFAFETVNKLSFKDSIQLIKGNGTLVLSSASFEKTIRGIFNKKKVLNGLTKTSLEDLKVLKKMMENGSLIPFIDSVYSLDQIQEAHRRVETGHKGGSVVLKILD